MLRLLLPLVLSLVALTHGQTIGIRLASEPPLTPEQIDNLEQAVQRNPTDIATRLRLLRHYELYPEAGFSPRLRHILSFIERLPADANASTPLTYVPLRSAVGHNTLRDAWMQALQRFPNEDRGLINAVRFLYREHPQEAEQLLRQARDRSPANRTLAANLGFFYVLHILGLCSPAHTTSTRSPELHQQLRQTALQQLERTSHPYVLTVADRALRNLYPAPASRWMACENRLRSRRSSFGAQESAGPNDPVLHGPMPLIQEFVEFQRADMTGVAEPAPALPPTIDSPEQAYIVDRLEQEAKLIYPELAQKARTQGAVLFRLLIDKQALSMLARAML